MRWRFLPVSTSFCRLKNHGGMLYLSGFRMTSSILSVSVSVKLPIRTSGLIPAFRSIALARPMPMPLMLERA